MFKKGAAAGRESGRHGRLTINALVGVGAVLGFFFSAPLQSNTGMAYTQAAPGIIRLHVIAASNLPRDQEVKLLVRREVLKRLAPLLREAGNTGQVRAIVGAERGRLRTAVRRVLSAAGVSYGVRLAFGETFFPTKADGALVLPAGNYMALRVILGRGRGQNWWCVLFPPLCLSDYTVAVAPAEPLPGKLPAGAPDRSKVKLEWWFLKKLADQPTAASAANKVSSRKGAKVVGGWWTSLLPTRI